MRYLLTFAASALLAVPVLLAAGIALAPAPIAAEYWVRQAMVVKADIARRHGAGRKALVVGGSSALFSMDTSALTREFHVPFVNLATHVHIPLATQLDNATALAGRGDIVILALEPGYYCPPEGDTWYVRNAIAWNPEAWRAMPLAERAIGLWRAGPWFLAELAVARAVAAVVPAAIGDRLEALDDATTLRRFASAVPARQFGYTLANLDPLGNMRGTEGTRRLQQEGFAAEAPLAVCPPARSTLAAFVRRARGADVEVRFAYSPFMESPSKSAEAIAAGARAFEADLASIAPLLEPRGEVVFPRNHFFDTGLHLNSDGRARRTATLARAIRADASLMARLGEPPR